MCIVIGEGNPDDECVLDIFIHADALYDELYPGNNQPVFSNDFLRNESFFLIAKHNGNIVGCGGIIAKKPCWAEIKRMYVKPDYRLNKIGSSLLDGLIQWSVNKKIYIVRLETGIYQPEAIALYEKYDFHTIECFEGYKKNPYSLFYEKSLS